MTTAEAIAAVRRGERVTNEHSTKASEDADKAQRCHHFWRTLFCDNETDVVECGNCGQQKLARCNFDDEYA